MVIEYENVVWSDQFVINENSPVGITAHKTLFLPRSGPSGTAGNRKYFKNVADNVPRVVIPKGLRVLGGLIIYPMDNVAPLPDDLWIKSGLYLDDTNLAFPPTTYVGGTLSLEHYPYDDLPDNMHIRIDLNLSNCLCKTLPNGLTVDNNLFIRNFKGKRLPRGLTVGGNLWLQATNVKEFPPDLIVRGCVYVSTDSKLAVMPKPAGVTKLALL